MTQYQLINQIIQNLDELESYGACCGMDERLNQLMELADEFMTEMVICENCGRILSADAAHIYDNEAYCGCCYGELDRTGDIIKSYHDHKGKFEFKDMGEPVPKEYRGFELEIEAEDISEEILEVLRKYEGEFHFEEDGSLNCGFEVISNPMSFDYWRSRGYDKIKGLIEELQEVGEVTSWETGTCGLHVHFSRDEWSNDTLRTLIRLLVRNHEYFELLSGRENFEYCRMPRYENYDLDSLSNSDRYLALNFNRETVEFRFFRGTLNLESIWCSIEILNHLLRYCEHIVETDVIGSYTLSGSGFEDWLKVTTSNADRLIQFIGNRMLGLKD